MKVSQKKKKGRKKKSTKRANITDVFSRLIAESLHQLASQSIEVWLLPPIVIQKLMVVIVCVGLCSKDASEMCGQVEYFRQSSVGTRESGLPIPECCDSRMAEKGIVDIS